MILLKMSFLSGVLIMVIAAIRLIMLYRLPRKTFLVLWNVALYRLLIPFFIPSRFSVYTMADTIKNKFLQGDNFFISDIVLSMNAVANTATDITSNAALTNMPGFSIQPIAAVWLIGLLVCSWFFLITHLRYIRELNFPTSIIGENT